MQKNTAIALWEVVVSNISPKSLRFFHRFNRLGHFLGLVAPVRVLHELRAGLAHCRALMAALAEREQDDQEQQKRVDMAHFV